MRGSFSACRSGLKSGFGLDFKSVALRAAWIAGACGVTGASVAHAQSTLHSGTIFEDTASSLTVYRGMQASGRFASSGADATGQGIRPRFSNRAFAVGFGGGEVDSPVRDVDLFALAAQIGDVDLSFPTNGPGVTISRSYYGGQLDGSSAYSSDGYQGHNWFQGARPELLRGSSTNSTSNYDMLYLVLGASRVMEFRLVGSSTTLFAGVNGTQAVAKLIADGSGDPGVIEVYDLSGRVWTFFDFDGDAEGAQGQLWKVTDEDGTGGTAYIGTSNTKAAALAAFEVESSVKTARVTNMVDASDRNFEFTYTTVGGAKRLASVVAKIRTGGTWASPTGVSEVGRVEYEYYTADVTDKGKTGNLKWVVTTTPLSSGGSLVRRTYYRYLTTSGQEHMVRRVVGPDRPSFSIKYESSKKAPSGGVQLISRDYRRSYAGTGGTTQFAAVQYDYGTSGGIDDTMGRVRSVKASLDGTTFTTVATYDYLGAGQLVGTTLNQPNLETKLQSGSGTSTTYPDMDRFGRPLTWDWQRVGGAAFYDVDIAYDRNSNPTSTTDNIHVRYSSGNRMFDVLYGLDNLNRVTSADEGKLASGSISNRTSKEAWTLSQTGNWTANTRDLDGNGTNDYNFSGTFNDANEWTSRSESVISFTENMTYDANGNMTSWGYREGDGNKYTYIYDGFGRLKKVQTNIISVSPVDLAVYRYNGLGYRIQWQYDDNLSQSLTDSERFYFLYDDRWRIVATFRDLDTNPKESFVYHAAGVAGRGGSSYIDSVILRDKDANTAWTSAADSSLEERRFYAQNWRADVIAITKSDGQPTEFIRYTSYGTAQAFAAADVNRDGVVNSTDSADWDLLYTEAGTGGAAISADFNFDGSGIDPADYDAFTAAYTEASGWTNGGLGAGGGKLSRIGNRKGYAGYEYDPAIVSYHVRHRVYVPEIGRWTKRDPLGYVDGMSVYEYVSSQPNLKRDHTGLLSDEGPDIISPERWAPCEYDPKCEENRYYGQFEYEITSMSSGCGQCPSMAYDPSGPNGISHLGDQAVGTALAFWCHIYDPLSLVDRERDECNFGCKCKWRRPPLADEACSLTAAQLEARLGAFHVIPIRSPACPAGIICTIRVNITRIIHSSVVRFPGSCERLTSVLPD